jgi:hypothetical protein
MVMARVREARFEDYGGIAALEERYGLFTTPEADWRRRWQDNPAIQGESEPWPIGWVIETEAEKIVGFFGNIPMAYEIDGERVLAAATNSWVVDDDHRGQALNLLSRFLAQPGVNLFLSTTANSETTKAMIAFKTKKTPQPDCDEALFWITGYTGFGRALAAKAGVPLGGVFGSLAGLGFGVADAVLGRPSAEVVEGCRLTAAFDDRFDQFWQRLRARPGTLRLVRDSATMNWHFNRFLADDRAWIVTCETPGETTGTLAGYAVFVRQDNDAIGLTRALLVDIQVDIENGDDDADVLRRLFLAGLGECRARGLHVLEAIGLAATKRDVLKRLSPWTRRLPTWPYLYKARDAAMADILSNPACWDIGHIDGDASL